MGLPYFNLYPTDFEADTSHLTLEEDGAYNRLLRLCWMSPGCSLPDDDAWIMRRMRVDFETYERVVRIILDEFFTRKSGRVSNARLAREFVESNAAHERRVFAGKRGGNAKALKTKETGSSIARAMPKQPEPEPDKSKRDTNVSPKKPRKSQIPPDAVLSENQLTVAMGKGLSEAEAAAQFDRFKSYCLANGKGYIDWNAAWRNWLDSPFFKPTTGGHHGERNHVGKRVDPALANIARLTGIGEAQGDGDDRNGSDRQEVRPLRLGA